MQRAINTAAGILAKEPSISFRKLAREVIDKIGEEEIGVKPRTVEIWLSEAKLKG